MSELPKYTKVRNDFLERRDLSAVEKLILQYVAGRFSKSGPWEINADQIRLALNLGHDATDGAIAKLKVKGWFTRNPAYRDSATGRMKRDRSVFIEARRADVILTDVLAAHTESGYPGVGYPGVGNPDRESPRVMKDCPDEGQSHEGLSHEGHTTNYMDTCPYCRSRMHKESREKLVMEHWQAMRG